MFCPPVSQFRPALEVGPPFRDPCATQPFFDVPPLGYRGVRPPEIGQSDDPHSREGLQARQAAEGEFGVSLPRSIMVGQDDHVAARQGTPIGLPRGLGPMGTGRRHQTEITVGGRRPFPPRSGRPSVRRSGRAVGKRTRGPGGSPTTQPPGVKWTGSGPPPGSPLFGLVKSNR